MNRWVLAPVPRPQARLRLFCLPAAGSGASMYRGWPRRLPPHVEVLLVQPPGRENRLADPPAEDYPTAVTALEEGLGPLLDTPYVLFGHSMGGLLAFGLAQRRRDRGLRQPQRLIVSGIPAPHRYDRAGERALAESDDERLLASLADRGGTADAVLTDPDLLALVLPTLRADYRVCASLPETTGEPLDSPITALSGVDDIDGEALHEWKHWTHAETSVRVFPGGHFFLINESQDMVLDAIASDLGNVYG